MDIEYLRSFKFLKMAVFDWSITILTVLIIVFYFNLNLLKWLIAIPILTILFHKLFNVNTQLVKYYDNNILIKILIILGFLYI